jgi:hypothetical protein
MVHHHHDSPMNAPLSVMEPATVQKFDGRTAGMPETGKLWESVTLRRSHIHTHIHTHIHVDAHLPASPTHAHPHNALANIPPTRTRTHAHAHTHTHTTHLPTSPHTHTHTTHTHTRTRTQRTCRQSHHGAPQREPDKAEKAEDEHQQQGGFEMPLHDGPAIRERADLGL